MTRQLDAAVELLDRSLAYTRVMLADVLPDHLDRPTPCVGWTLSRLLAHMEDALDAFIEAAAGQVQVDPITPSDTRVGALREKACTLLGAWTAGRPVDGDRLRQVAVGELSLDAHLLVATAALEITLHGWDVGQSTGLRTPIPDDLAAKLLPVAREVIDASDRGDRFAGPRPASPDAPFGERLLAWAGRAPDHMPHPPVGQPSTSVGRDD